MFTVVTGTSKFIKTAHKGSMLKKGNSGAHRVRWLQSSQMVTHTSAQCTNLFMWQKYPEPHLCKFIKTAHKCSMLRKGNREACRVSGKEVHKGSCPLLHNVSL